MLLHLPNYGTTSEENYFCLSDSKLCYNQYFRYSHCQINTAYVLITALITTIYFKNKSFGLSIISSNIKPTLTWVWALGPPLRDVGNFFPDFRLQVQNYLDFIKTSYDGRLKDLISYNRPFRNKKTWYYLCTYEKRVNNRKQTLEL